MFSERLPYELRGGPSCKKAQKDIADAQKAAADARKAAADARKQRSKRTMPPSRPVWEMSLAPA